jgi:hypothetical protein
MDYRCRPPFSLIALCHLAIIGFAIPLDALFVAGKTDFPTK